MAKKPKFYRSWEMDSPYDNDPIWVEQKIRTLRWELDLYPDDGYFTLEELEEMKQEKDDEEAKRVVRED